MSSHLRLLTGFLAVLSLSASGAQAGTIVVDPAGGGQYTSLQAAINAAAPGDVIVIKGGEYSMITIDKALTLVGNPAPKLLPGFNPQMGSVQQGAITLAGHGGKLVLANINTGGNTHGELFSSSHPTISGGGFSQLHIVDCQIMAPTWKYLSGTGMGATGLSTGIPLIILSNSTLNGLSAGTDSCYENSEDGGIAIEATASTVVLLDSTVTGGNGAYLCSYKPTPPPNWHTGCPCYGEAGMGGDGIHAKKIIRANSTITAGQGLPVYYNVYTFSGSGGPLLGTFFGVQPSGVDIVSPTVIDLDNDLSSSSPFNPGSTWNVSWMTTQQADVFLTGTQAITPLNISQGWLFAEPSSLLQFPIAAPAQGLSTLLPPESTMPLGTEFVFQVYDSAAHKLTRPLVLVAH